MSELIPPSLTCLVACETMWFVMLTSRQSPLRCEIRGLVHHGGDVAACDRYKSAAIKDDLLVDQRILQYGSFLNVWIGDTRTEPTVKSHVSQALWPGSNTQTPKNIPLFGQEHLQDLNRAWAWGRHVHTRGSETGLAASHWAVGRPVESGTCCRSGWTSSPAKWRRRSTGHSC